MRKTRTIEIRHGRVYYHGIFRGYLTGGIIDSFNLPDNGKVRITIEEKGPYEIRFDRTLSTYDVYENLRYVGLVCCKPFERLFFKPDGRKSYDIIVKVLER